VGLANSGPLESKAVGEVRTVYKYDLPMGSVPGEIHPIRLPAGSKILKVGEQTPRDALDGPSLFIWVLIDPQEKFQELRYVVTAGTGHEIELTKLSERDWDYNDTVLCSNGIVVHVWVSRPEGKQKGVIEVSGNNG
jgi:hypothetical protein